MSPVHRLVVLVAFVLAAVACGRGGEAEPRVVDAGSSVGGGFVRIAALVRNDAGRTLGPIRLSVRLEDGGGGVVATTRDSLPYCPAGSSCWWAGTFPIDRYRNGGAIRTAAIGIVSGAPRYTGRTRVEGFELRRLADGRLHGTAPGGEGHAYIVASRDDDPVGGMAVVVSPPSTEVFIASRDAAGLGRGEVRGYFYAGPVARGD